MESVFIKVDCRALYKITFESLPQTTQSIVLGPRPRWGQTPLQRGHRGRAGRITGPDKRLTACWVCACAPLAPRELKLPYSATTCHHSDPHFEPVTQNTVASSLSLNILNPAITNFTERKLREQMWGIKDQTSASVEDWRQSIFKAMRA